MTPPSISQFETRSGTVVNGNCSGWWCGSSMWGNGDGLSSDTRRHRQTLWILEFVGVCGPWVMAAIWGLVWQWIFGGCVDGHGDGW